MGYNYWGATDEIIAEGRAPTCPHCGKRMFPQDDHGRFACFCQGIGRTIFDGVSGTLLPTPQIPQVDTTGMTDEEKAQIPGINRLDAMPTAAEAEYLRLMLTGGPQAIGTPEHEAAVAAIKAERDK